MSQDYVKDYFNKVKSSLDVINQQDTFFDAFTQAIANGEKILFQKHFRETKIFDDSWVEHIETHLQYLDNIMRNPRSFIKDFEEIVPVERVKKTTAESFRYLASHSYQVKEVTRKGEVIPKKLLTNYKEEDLGIYENRFIKTLTDKLIMFVEKRYTTIKELIGTDHINKFHNEAKFNYDQVSIDYELNLNVTQKISDTENDQKSLALLERIEKLRGMLISFTESELMTVLRGTRPIVPPVQKTNIIMKEPNYKKCYELWLFLDSYGTLEYSIDRSMSQNTFDKPYLQSLQNLTLLSFSTIIANDEANMGEYKSVPTIAKKTKKPIILNNLDEEKPDTSLDMESNLFNEYYYQQARKLYNRKIQEQVNDGEPFHTALLDIYQSAFKITETIFNDLLQVPDNIKKDPRALLRYRMRNQKALDKIYAYKQRDLKKMEKEKAKNERIIAREKAKLEGRPLPLTEKQLLLKKAREKAKLLRMKEKEKERLAKQKEREKEKLRLAKQKAKEKERLAKLKAKAKEKKRLALLKAKEKAKKLKEKEKEKLLNKNKTSHTPEVTEVVVNDIINPTIEVVDEVSQKNESDEL
jgi:hypothetical protein